MLPVTGCEGPDGEQKYISTVSITLAIDRGGWVVNINVVKIKVPCKNKPFNDAEI